MKYLLDTNICIYWLKGVVGIDKKMFSVISSISLSVITIAELLYGAYDSTNVEKILLRSMNLKMQ